MSQLLERAPRFSSATALLRHYAGVRQRMNALSIRTQRALPSPEMMARGNQPPVAAVVLVEAPKVEEPTPVVFDPIPDQRCRPTHLIKRLEPELERLGVRRTVELFYERVGSRGCRSRALILRNCTATAFRVSESCLLEHRRFIAVTRMRQISMALMGWLLDDSLPGIGRALGGRDHTTVLHAQRKMKPLISDVLTEMFDGKSCPVPAAETPEQDEDGGW